VAIRHALNEKSQYLINWNRPGSLFFGNHRYSNREVLERAFVLVMITAGGYLGSQSREYSTGACVVGASLSFFIAHTITMSPLIYKRLEAKWACEKLQKQINSQLIDKDDGYCSMVNNAVTSVLEHVHSKSPSAVWGHRKRLLTNLHNLLNHPEIPFSQLAEILNERDVIYKLEQEELSFLFTCK
jgi:hypothetical protein